MFHSGFPYTPLDAIATCWIPRACSQATSSNKSAGMLPKRRASAIGWPFAVIKAQAAILA